MPTANFNKAVNILALETSTEACSVALLRADGAVFGEFAIAPRQHTRLLPQMMDAVIASSGVSKKALTHCAFANGPGAFTGIRIAAASAQGIALALDIPLVPVSTLATLAQTCFDKHAVDSTLVALDARMDEVYWARYTRDERGLARLLGIESLDSQQAVSIEPTLACGVGHGWSVAGEYWKTQLDPAHDFILDAELLPDAHSLLKLASQAVIESRFVAAQDVRINYLRNRVAEKSQRK